MSLDKDIKDAFQKHEQDARASDTAWSGVETKIRRAHRRRVTFSASAALLVIAAIAVLVPTLAAKDKNSGFTNPTPGPSLGPSTKPTAEASTNAPPPGPVIPAGWQRRVGVQSAFQLAIPADWKGGWFEGTWDFEPKGLPGGQQDGDTFTVTVTLQPGNYDAASGPGAAGTTVNGHRAVTWHPSATETDYSIEWFHCPGYTEECSSNFETQTLVARLHATNDTLWSQYEVTGLNVVHTLFEYDGGTPVHGTTAAAIKDDASTEALIRFLDARVEGIGADELMTSKAATQYAAIGLYQTGVPSVPYVKFEVTAVAPDAGGNAETFTVNIFIDPNEWTTESITLVHASSQSPPLVDSGSVVSRSNQDGA
jgi:hypothetical protein